MLGDFTRQGQLLLWNPWSNCGSPDYADPQAGALSPLKLAASLLPDGASVGFRAYWLLLWWLGGASMLLLGRQLGAPPWGALVVALGFTFSGFFTGQSEHTPCVSSVSFLPLVVCRLDAALLARRLWPAIEAGGLWGLGELAGYPGIALMTAPFLALWVLGRCLTRDERGHRLSTLAAAKTLAVLALTATVVTAPLYGAFLVEGAGFTDRTGRLPREVALGHNALHPGAIATLASPSVARLKVVHRSLWSYTDPSSCSIYVGAVVPILAMGAAASLDGFALWLAALGLFGLGTALARVLPLRAWLYDLVPLMDRFRHPSFFRVLAIFCACALALHVLGRAEGRPGLRRAAVVAVVLAPAALGLHVLLCHGWPMERGLRTLGHAHAVASWLGALLALLAGCLPLPRARSSSAVLLVTVAMADALGTAAISRIFVATSGPSVMRTLARVDRWRVRTLPVTDTRRHELPAGMTRNSLHLLLKVPVVQCYQPFTNLLYERMAADPVLRAAVSVRHRFWFSPTVATVAPTHGALHGFLARTGRLDAPPIVLHSREHMRRLADTRGALPSSDEMRLVEALPPARRLPADVLVYAPDELVLRVTCPSEGWLWVTDRWARGWRATRNGRPQEVLGANFGFRAVRVERGENEVAFRYRPIGYPWLIVPSWSAVAVAVGSLARSAVRRRCPR